MKDYSSIRDQILNGFLLTIWLFSLPFIGVYKLIKWFVVSITKEAGNKIVKIVGGLIAFAVIGLIFNYFK